MLGGFLDLHACVCVCVCNFVAVILLTLACDWKWIMMWLRKVMIVWLRFLHYKVWLHWRVHHSFVVE